MKNKRFRENDLEGPGNIFQTRRKLHSDRRSRHLVGEVDQQEDRKYTLEGVRARLESERISQSM